MLDFITEKQSSWDFLKQTELPVFIYGMGDGALKILSAFEKHGIAAAGFFASDEFVRGHYFEGHLVHKLSHIEELIDEFVVVLAFAAVYSFTRYDGLQKLFAALRVEVFFLLLFGLLVFPFFGMDALAVWESVREGISNGVHGLLSVLYA